MFQEKKAIPSAQIFAKHFTELGARGNGAGVLHLFHSVFEGGGGKIAAKFYLGG